jgi:hypothetical protein
MPKNMRNSTEPWDKEFRREQWWSVFRASGCLMDATSAARQVGVEISPRDFGLRCRKHYRAQITEILNEAGMAGEEVIAHKAKTARNVASQYWIPEDPEDPKNRNMVLDVRTMFENGDGDQVIGSKRDAKGNLIYELADPAKAQSDILDVHGLRRQKMEHTGADGGPIDIVSSMTSQQRADAMNALIEKGRAKLSDNPERSTGD